jgi:ABC-type cobalamin/Fe3+-siderophores transport system ATPase subunit
MLEVDGITYSYEGGTAALDEVTAAFRPGELVALAGPNGSGKSTLLKCLARVLRPAAGSISFEGRRLSGWPAREYARHVGYLPQNPDPAFPMRAIDVVVSGRAPFLGRFAWESSSDYGQAERALALCDASHLGQRFLDEMSGGERKRVYLARVLAGHPKVILLDEPLAALDVSHVQQFSRLLREIVDRTNSSVIFASHDLNWSAAYADRMLVIQKGKLVRDGAPAAVMTPAVLAEFFGLDAEIVVNAGRSWVVPRL